MANSRDFTGKNRKFTGTKGIITPKGTTGQRVGSESGELRFNTTTELMEYYDGNQWKPIDAPPTISSISTSDAQGTNNILNADGSSLFTITITGGNFSIGPNVKFIGSTGTEYTAGNINRVSASSITCTTLITMGTTDDPYDVSVINTSGLSATLDDAFSFNAPPVFVTASGSLGTVYDGQVISGTTLNAGATDAEGNTITFSIISGSLPGSGLSISSSTGAITGTLGSTPSLGNYPFVVQAATTEGTVQRQFSIQVIAIPTYSIDFLVVAGGGSGGGNGHGSGGGAGGFRTSTQSATIGTVITVTVGDGGAAQGGSQPGVQGSSSSISGSGLSTISSAGGGRGVRDTRPNSPGGSGGSGGGGSHNGDNVPGGTGGAGNTPSTVPSQGNNGGVGTGLAPNYGQAGGGGASGVGGNGTSTTGGAGGAGTASSITGTSVTRAGGGGGSASGGGGSGSGGAGGGGAAADGGAATGGIANTGGGGGGSNGNSGGAGGKGVVILSVPTANYSSTTTGSPTVTTSGGNTIMVFNGSGSYTA